MQKFSLGLFARYKNQIISASLLFFLILLVNTFSSYAKIFATNTPNAQCTLSFKIDDILAVAESESSQGSLLDGSRYLLIAQSSNTTEVSIYISPPKDINKQFYFTYDGTYRNFGFSNPNTEYPAYKIRMTLNPTTNQITHTTTNAWTGTLRVLEGNNSWCHFAISDDFPTTVTPQQGLSSTLGGYSQYWLDNNDGEFLTTFTERRALENPPAPEPEPTAGITEEYIEQKIVTISSLALSGFIGIMIIKQFRWRGTT